VLTEIARQFDHPHAPTLAARDTAQQGKAVVGGAVVDEDDFPVAAEPADHWFQPLP